MPEQITSTVHLAVDIDGYDIPESSERSPSLSATARRSSPTSGRHSASYCSKQANTC